MRYYVWLRSRNERYFGEIKIIYLYFDIEKGEYVPHKWKKKRFKLR